MDDIVNNLKFQTWRDRLITIKREFKEHVESGGKSHHQFVAVTTSMLDKEIGKAKRNAFFSWLCDRPITTSKYNVEGGLTQFEGFALSMWSMPAPRVKADGSTHWECLSQKIELDVRIIATALQGVEDGK